MLWNFLQLLDSKRNREVWVHPINQKINLTGFIAELRLDHAKFYNYCRMTMSTFAKSLSTSTDVGSSSISDGDAIEAQDTI